MLANVRPARSGGYTPCNPNTQKTRQKVVSSLRLDRTA